MLDFVLCNRPTPRGRNENDVHPSLSYTACICRVTYGRKSKKIAVKKNLTLKCIIFKIKIFLLCKGKVIKQLYTLLCSCIQRNSKYGLSKLHKRLVLCICPKIKLINEFYTTYKESHIVKNVLDAMVS